MHVHVCINKYNFPHFFGFLSIAQTKYSMYLHVCINKYNFPHFFEFLSIALCRQSITGYFEKYWSSAVKTFKLYVMSPNDWLHLARTVYTECLYTIWTTLYEF